MNLDAFAADARHWGWRSALLTRATAKLERWLGLWIYRVYFRSLAIPRDPLVVPKGITVRLLTEAQLIQHAKDPELDLDSRFIRRAMSRGDLAFGAYEQDELVGYTWRTASTAPFFNGLWIRVPKPFTYGYKSYTVPTHRGRGVHAAFASFADRHARAIGHPMMLTLIDISNPASLRASTQMGSRKAGYAGYLKLFGRCFTFRTPLARSIGVDFYKAPREVRPPAGDSADLPVDPGLAKA